MKKKLLFLFVTMIALTVVVTGCGKKGNNGGEEGNGTTIESNTNAGVVEDKALDVFTFTNTSLIWNGNSSDLETTITNNSDEDAYLKGFNVYVYDAEGNVIATMEGYVSDHIKAHGTRVMSTGHYANLSKAAKVEYEVVR